MGTIIKRELKSGDIKFIVQHRVAGTPYESKQFDDEYLAIEYEKKRDAELRMQASCVKGGSVKSFMELRFCDLIDQYLQQDIKKHRNGLVMIKPFVADMTMAELNRLNVKELIRQALKSKTYLKTNYKGGTIAKMFTCANAAYLWKLEQMGLPDMAPPFKQNYIREIAGPIDIARERRLEPDEEVRLRERLERIKKHGEWSLIIDLAIETAARQQELVLATWKEFDFRMGIWNIPREHTKAKKARQMPLSPKAMQILLDHQEKLGYPEKSARIFIHLHNTDVVSTMFRKLTHQANIVDFHFHDLRHEAISRIVLNKPHITVFEIMKMVGHSSIDMLHRYTNLKGEELSMKFNRT